jgi:hypothetical protein
VNLFWVVLMTATSATLGSGLCLWLLHQARETDSSLWIVRQVLCPVIRIILLLIVVSLTYPAIDDNFSSAAFWQILSPGQFNDLLNILFLAGLLLSFLPLVNHPALALPIQSIFSLALLFHWQYAGSIESITLFPSITTLLQIVAYMALAYFVTRETSIQVARWIDHKLVVSGSVRVVAEAIYLVLQIPVMLVYCSFLRLQLS